MNKVIDKIFYIIGKIIIPIGVIRIKHPKNGLTKYFEIRIFGLKIIQYKLI